MFSMKDRRQRRQIEREFGVPVAGEILPESQWAHTALKKLPAEGPLDWQVLFGRRAPTVIDLGCGNGRYLISSAVWRTDHDHLGVDILPLVLRYATRRGNQRGLKNLRFAACDGLTLLERFIPPGSVRELHIYHPQPYHDQRLSWRRLISPHFLGLAHRALEPGGQLFVQTDNLPYWNYMKLILPALFEFEQRPAPWPDAPKGRTRREIIALRRGMPVYRGHGTVRPVSPDQVASLIQSLPLPLFDAGPAHQEIDDLELDEHP